MSSRRLHRTYGEFDAIGEKRTLWEIVLKWVGKVIEEVVTEGMSRGQAVPINKNSVSSALVPAVPPYFGPTNQHLHPLRQVGLQNRAVVHRTSSLSPCISPEPLHSMRPHY